VRLGESEVWRTRYSNTIFNPASRRCWRDQLVVWAKSRSAWTKPPPANRAASAAAWGDRLGKDEIYLHTVHKTWRAAGGRRWCPKLR
jgi:hypothetical protein